ncbi:MAG: hemolysin family protein [Rhodospirillales bacterium]|jgi:CBS domain containing-hemolysin-like protein|nr:magnesium/cobalt efflux protein [Rhodospirillaceae bacterium]MDP6429923.1 hemolysin family protein [Rhodospirillales bacterium]MDP6642635.1 hemolysin family protein [Rhodospirillales bacterium]MDP6840563.1 hemolysin family protein [Rhodospirillales bacterium]|tara:strand:+ start:497 stop:1417 length:921 start_codon:yes stop_codon:yes gene_type:complete
MNDGPDSPAPSRNGTEAPPARARGWLGLLGRIFGIRNGDVSVREAIEELIEESPEAVSAMETEERTLLANILSLRELTVDDVMVPRADIIAIEESASLEVLIELINRESHSRVPVYRKTLDDAIGMVHIKDVLAAENAQRSLDLSNILRDVLFVSPSMQVLELLLEMRVKRIHMALVVDEFGGVDGLATIEDLVEEIVGEIEDEHDRDVEPEMLPRPDGSFDADARVALEVFEDKIGPVLSDEERQDIETLGGLVFTLTGRVPIRGELVTHPSGVEIEVLEADPRRVKRLRIRAPEDSAAVPAGNI